MELLLFLVKSTAVSFVLMVNYWAFLRNRKCHYYNRVYLLAVIVLSFVVPLSSFSFINTATDENSSINKIVAVVNGHPGWLTVFATITAVISCLLVLLLVLRIVRLYRIKANNPHTAANGFIFIETYQEHAPFSFFNNLYWNPGISPEGIEGRKIVQHELTHIREKHTYDKLFASLVSCVCWPNPVFWLIQNELAMVHEFIADENSIEPGDTSSFAAMLLASYSRGRYLDPVNSFYHSPVKRRLTMISRKQPVFVQLRKMAVAPAIVMAIAFCSFKIIPPRSLLQKQYNEKKAAEKAAMNGPSSSN